MKEKSVGELVVGFDLEVSASAETLGFQIWISRWSRNSRKFSIFDFQILFCFVSSHGYVYQLQIDKPWCKPLLADLVDFAQTLL